MDPFHPFYPTAEIAIVIKTFELQIGISFMESLLCISNSLQSQFDASDALFFTDTLSKSKKSLDQQTLTLSKRLSEIVYKQVLDRIDDAQQS